MIRAVFMGRICLSRLTIIFVVRMLALVHETAFEAATALGSYPRFEADTE